MELLGTGDVLGLSPYKNPPVPQSMGHYHCGSVLFQCGNDKSRRTCHDQDISSCQVSKSASESKEVVGIDNRRSGV